MERFEAFTGSVLELNRYLQKIKDLEMKPFGLRAGHVMCLYYLGKNPDGLTATELTEACREDKAAISRSVSFLVERQLIRGDFAAHKRSYRTKLYLTDSGKELVETIDRRIDAAMTQGGSGLTDQQRKNFYEAMEIIIHNLAQYVEEKETEGRI